MQQLAFVSSRRRGYCPPLRRRCPLPTRRRRGGGGNDEGCRGGKSTCRASRHSSGFRDAPGCRVPFEGTWTPSALQVFRTYRRCSEGGAYAGGGSPGDVRIDDRPAGGPASVVACGVIAAVGQKRGKGVNHVALMVVAPPVRRAASWRRARSTASLNEVAGFSPPCNSCRAGCKLRCQRVTVIAAQGVQPLA